MNADEAQAALMESGRLQRETVQAGSAPWPWSLVLTAAGALVALGLITDLNMIWMYALLILGSWGIFKTNGVKLRETRRSRGWGIALGATFLLALAADVAVQLVVRGADVPLPNTWGAAAAALTVIAVSRPVQGRMAASRQP
jgi:hypothetical protein